MTPSSKPTKGMARSSSGSLMTTFAATRTGYPNTTEVYLGVSCIDYAWPETLAEFQALAAVHRVAAPHFGEANLLQSALPCLYWGAAPQPLQAPTAAGAPPIVVVATTGDPATPYESGVALSRQLASGVLLTNVGEGHTVYGRGNACVDRAVDAYLLTLQTFADGSRCTRGSDVLLGPDSGARLVLPFLAVGP